VEMAANASSTRSLALVGAKLTTGLQNIRRLAAKAAPHRQQTSPVKPMVKPMKVEAIYGAIFFYRRSSIKTWAHATIAWTEAKI
jgi:hypothetical protein